MLDVVTFSEVVSKQCSGEHSLNVFKALLYFKIYWFALAATAKYYRQCGLNNRSLFFHNSGSPKFKVLTGLLSSDASLLFMYVAIFLWPHMVFATCVPSFSLSVQISSLFLRRNVLIDKCERYLLETLQIPPLIRIP
jgi:hypothetical protein